MELGWAPNGEGVALMGVSGAVAAVLAAYATILPELESTVNLFFVAPVRLRTKMVGLAGTALAFILCIVDAPAFSTLWGVQGDSRMANFRDGMACVGPVANDLALARTEQRPLWRRMSSRWRPILKSVFSQMFVEFDWLCRAGAPTSELRSGDRRGCPTTETRKFAS